MDIASIIQKLSIIALPVLIAITFHEAAHGFVAFRKGDPTAKFMGRLTLNPLAHIDLFGTILMPAMLYFIPLLVSGQPGWLFGYAKPVPVNYFNLRRPKVDMVWVAAAGPGTNLVLALLSGLLLRVLLTLDPNLQLYRQHFGGSIPDGSVVAAFLSPIAYMLEFSVEINILLMIFNLIPIPPLDGGRVMMGLLPEKQAGALSKLEPYGFLILIFLLFLDPLRTLYHVLGPLFYLFKGLILGGVAT
ncbi:MAG TPA: site-2 protease family protein [Nitrospiria bacterium]|nr:site-2 protease family protein [Nitrospiria bacterium]